MIATNLLSITLEHSMMEAISQNSAIQENKKRYKEIYYDLQKAKSGYLPKIDFSIDIPILNSQNSNHKLYNAKLSAKENIFNGFGDISRENVEYFKYNSAFYKTKEITNVFAFSVISSYIDILKEKAMYDIVNASIENHTNIFKKTKIQYNGGIGTKLEYVLSKSSLKLAKINLYEQEHTLKQSIINLEKFLDKKINISDIEYPVNDIVIPSTVQEAIEIALETHPSMLVARLNTKMTKQELEEAKKSYYPSLDIKGDTFFGDKSRYRNIDNYYQVYLELNYNLYNGGSDVNNVKKIEMKELQKKILINQKRIDIIHKIKSHYYNYEILKNNYRYLNEYAVLKKEVLESYYLELSIGKVTLNDILNATESLYTANKMRVKGFFDLLKAKYSILEAIGKLPEINYSHRTIRYDFIKFYNDEDEKGIPSKDNKITKTIEETLLMESKNSVVKQKKIKIKSNVIKNNLTITKFTPTTFYLKKQSNIYYRVNGSILKRWDKGRSFTSNIRAGNWIKITGYFKNRRWKQARKDMWIEEKSIAVKKRK